MAIPGIDVTERPWERADDLRFNRPDLRNPTPAPADYSQYRQQGLRGGQWVNQPPTTAAPPGAPVTPTAPAAQAAKPGLLQRAGRALNPDVGQLVKGAPRAALRTLPLAVGMGAVDTLRDTNEYADAFRASVGNGDGLAGRAGAGALRFLDNVGNAATFGLAGKLGRGISSALGGGSFVEGWESPSLRDQTPGGQTPSLFGSSPATPQPAQTQPAQPQAQPAAGQAPALPLAPAPNPIIREGNSYSGTNVGPGAPIYQRGANGQLNLRDAGYVPSGIDSGAASAQRVADIYQSMSPQAPIGTQAPVALHSGNDWARRNALRNLEVSASSMTNNGGGFDTGGRGRGRPQALTDSPAVAAYKMALAADLRAQGLQPELDLKTNEANNKLRGDLAGADATRYASDNSLRGSLYTANSNAAAARYKADGEAVLKQNELDITNADRARKQFTVFGADGKPDEGATQQAVLAVDKVIPGYSTMSEQARKQHSGEADTLFSVYNRLRAQKELGLGQQIFGNRNPGLDALPNLKGGKLRRHGLAGALPGQAGAYGYFVDMPDGRELNLGQGLSANELNLIQNHLATGEWTKKGGR